MLGFSIACSSSRSAASEDAADGRGDIGGKEIRDLEIQKQGWNEKASDPYTYEKVSLDGDRLKLCLRYSGGCKKHKFRLLTQKEYSKSSPPSAGLFLFHNADGDACRSVIRDTLRYDLKKLRYPASKELLLKLKGYDRDLSYAYP